VNDPIYSRLAASGYCVKPGYRHREKPELFDEMQGACDAITH